VAVTVEARSGDGWRLVGVGVTDGDGRVPGLVPDGALAAGEHRLTFATGAWFAAEELDGFYPAGHRRLPHRRPDAHYHVPLLLSPYGYSTYRGS
jgi:5-hydroxyisourate hydrolase